MEEILVKGITLPEAYHKALYELWRLGEEANCSDWNCRQKEVSMTMVVEHPLQEPRISKLMIGGPLELEQYVQEIVDGIFDFEIEKGNWAYTYHDRMVNLDGINQLAFVLEDLKRNPESRRSVVIIRDAKVDTGSADPACLQHIQFFIRKNKLHMKVLFRSNDAAKATFMNAFALIELQEQLAAKLHVGVGTYTHRANSFHCYSKDYEMLEGYCRSIESKSLEGIAFNYVDDWEPIMAECREAIEAKVEELKSH